MERVILLGANWCPVTKSTRELFDGLKEEDPNFDYGYVDIESEEGKSLVNNLSITDVPKTIFRNKIVFHGLPKKEELIKLIAV